MGLYKLDDGTSSVMLDPTRGLNIPENRRRQLIETKAGKPDVYEFGAAEEYQIPLINIPSAKAEQLHTWWEEQKVLALTPDQASPGDVIGMIIDGIKRPLNVWAQLFDSKYAGMLQLNEVSSISFSPSQVSVSGSRSCSAFGASESCSVFSSRSESAFPTFVSHSSSAGIDVVEDASRSSSISRSCSESFSESNSISYSVSRSCSDYLSESFYSSFISGGYSHFSGLFELSSCEDLSSRDNDPEVLSISSCEDLSSVSGSDSRSSSVGVIVVSFASYSGSLDPSVTSCSESVAGESCSESAGGIS